MLLPSCKTRSAVGTRGRPEPEGAKGTSNGLCRVRWAQETAGREGKKRQQGVEQKFKLKQPAPNVLGPNNKQIIDLTSYK